MVTENVGDTLEDCARAFPSGRELNGVNSARPFSDFPCPCDSTWLFESVDEGTEGKH